MKKKPCGSWREETISENERKREREVFDFDIRHLSLVDIRSSRDCVTFWEKSYHINSEKQSDQESWVRVRCIGCRTHTSMFAHVNCKLMSN